MITQNPPLSAEAASDGHRRGLPRAVKVVLAAVVALLVGAFVLSSWVAVSSGPASPNNAESAAAETAGRTCSSNNESSLCIVRAGDQMSVESVGMLSGSDLVIETTAGEFVSVIDGGGDGVVAVPVEVDADGFTVRATGTFANGEPAQIHVDYAS